MTRKPRAFRGWTTRRGPHGGRPQAPVGHGASGEHRRGWVEDDSWERMTRPLLWEVAAVDVTAASWR